MDRALRWERRPEERPRELLEAAISIFAERGYRNTRLEEVAEAAGVTKGTIYHYFATKEELLLRAVEHYHEQGFGRMEELLRSAEHEAPADRIRLFIQQSFGGDASRRKVLTMLLQGVAYDVPDVHREWLASGPLMAWRLLATLVREGQDAGDFRRDIDVEVACRTLVSGLILQLFWQTHGEGIEGYAIDEHRLLDASVEAFLHSLEPLR